MYGQTVAEIGPEYKPADALLANGSPPDFITIATANNRRLTKRHYLDADGKPATEDYDKAKFFDFTAEPVNSLDDLQRVIDSVGTDQCLILGKVKNGVDPHGAARRLHDRADGPATIEDTPHHWLPIDADGIEARDDKGAFDPIKEPERAVACVVKLMPGEFASADCVWQWTSSAGFKPGIRMRLYFWLDRPLTGAEMSAWLAPHRSAIDLSMYTPTQPIYAAPPVCDGVADPITKRTGYVCKFAVVIPPATIVVPNIEARGKGGTVAEGCQVDAAHVVARARDYLLGIVGKATEAEAASGYWGQEGDCDTYRIAERLGDFGVREKCVDLLVEELPGDSNEVEREWLEITVDNAFRYRQNAIGCDYQLARISDAEMFKDAKTPDTGPATFPRGYTATEMRAMQFAPARWAMHNTIELGQPAIMPGDRGTGKTTFGLGLGVASGAGVHYLGQPTTKMSTLAMLGEDGYGRAKEMIDGLTRDMHVPESVRDGIRVISTLDDAVPGGPVLCRITADHRNPASVKVEPTPFMTEAVLPLLREMAANGPVLWLIDPLEHYVEFDRNMPFTARAVADRWLVPLCRQFGGLLTPFVLDHPSKAAMQSGQHYAGSPALVNPFPAFLSLRKKLDGRGKPIVNEYQGIRQVSLEFETMRVKRAPERKVDLYRVGESPLLRTKPAEGLSLAAMMSRVYAKVEELRGQGIKVRIDDRSGIAQGPARIAMALNVDDKLVRDAMKALVEVRAYGHKNAATSGHAPRDPGGLVPTGIFGGSPPPAVFYDMIQERRSKLVVSRRTCGRGSN